ncbi:ankyrin repeat domain-containing protein [Aspergillus stella-maris]|uniref:ankyrin repeat domain-containing protein n=1 Tax=Aspergillus stella-maris TaxID=1810926 RepID=UPI003CCCC77A
MSFGYGAGDFLSIVLFANEIRRRFAYAPVQFKGTTESCKALSNVLRDIEDIDPDAVLNKSQKQQLGDISRSCYEVLHEFHSVLARFGSLHRDSTDPNTTRGLGSFSRHVWQRLKWDPKDIQSYEQRIRSQVAIFNLFIGKLNLQTNLVVYETTARSRDGIAAIKHYQADEEYDKILDWLCPNNFAAQQNDFLNQHQQGSGQWLLGASLFRDWLEKDKATLFCPGIPGAGKTIMVSMIIDYLEQEFVLLNNIGIAYLYCSFRRRPTQTFRDLLASLVRQLVQRDSSIPDCVRNAYSRSRNKKIQPSVNELLQFLQAMSAQLSRVFIVVDALDECESIARESLLAAIHSLQDQYNVNFLATSRYIPDTIAAFESCPSLEIRATMEDVWRYLRSQLSRLPSFVARNKELQCEIIAEVSKAVGGMFLLAKLHLDSLVGKRSQKAVQTALKSLPSGSNPYDSAYQTAMERIQGQVTDQREMAKQVLAWITCAGPLTTRELQHALAVEIGQPYLDESNVSDVEDIVSVCAGLVIVDEQSNIIRLVHYTAQEYFERTWMEWFPDAQQNIAATCVTYLSFNFFEQYYSALDGTQNDDRHVELLEQYPLYRYAAQNWGRHGPVKWLDEELVLNFLDNGNKVSCSAQVLLEDKAWPAPKHLDGLHLAAHFGLDETMYLLECRGHRLDIRDSLGRTPLSWVAGDGHTNLVRRLLSTGLSIDSWDAELQTPLAWAAKNGHRDVVELLLCHGAGKESRDTRGQTPLSLAARFGHRNVVECLLDAGADADSKDNSSRTALLWAITGEHLDVVNLLKDHTELDLENVPSNPSFATLLQDNNAEAQDTMKFEGCAKTNPTLPGGDQTGILYETSTISDDGFLNGAESKDKMIATDVNWPEATGLAERELNNG